MPKFEVSWQAQGMASLEADDASEAEDLVKEAVENFDTLQLDEFSVDNIEIVETEES